MKKLILGLAGLTMDLIHLWLADPPGYPKPEQPEREEDWVNTAEVERLTRERDELAKTLQRAGLAAADDAHTAADVAMAREDLRENGYDFPALAECVGRLVDDKNAALALARRCRDVALGERERIADFLNRDRSTVRALPAPTLPEIPNTKGPSDV